ncbi:exported hypothetical protein [Rhodococcus sp. RD6.2]|uniref:trypsin-like serine protease n=1 Tax=Rhodococcus sp. RD6.2 TaxID=260936 RepID=UPI00063B6C43|nr:trypsin-like serine protease [Rhodococcus sp. RD6.2]CRK49805.1 exported hypothetical protein [Rhodococcus sp. RD6.2]
MKRTIRYLTGLLAAASLVASLGVGTAQADEVPASTAKTVMPGMRITFLDPVTYPDYQGLCTLGAVGTDSAGRKVGITAGHCNSHQKYNENPDNHGDPTYDGAPVRTHTLTNDYKVWDWRDPNGGPIGWIRWVSNDGRQTNNGYLGKLDYMVIEFAPHVVLSSQLMRAPKYFQASDGKLDRSQILVPAQPLHKINTIYSNSAGVVQIPPVGSTICNIGSTTNERYVQTDSAFNMQCGPLKFISTGGGLPAQGTDGLVTPGVMLADVSMPGGDSGGPVIDKSRPNEWAGITSWRYRNFWVNPTFFEYGAATSAKTILDDLNPRGITGSGFQITNN